MAKEERLTRYLGWVSDGGDSDTCHGLDQPELGRLRRKVGVFWALAQNLASLSCCRRLGVGCVVVRPDFTEVVSIGYNGPASGIPNDSCRGTEGSCGCTHAEGSAVAKMRGESQGLVMVTTTLQCEHCAGLVSNCRRISGVIYGTRYRDPRGEHLLRSAGLSVVSISEILEGSDCSGIPDGDRDE